MTFPSKISVDELKKLTDEEIFILFIKRIRELLIIVDYVDDKSLQSRMIIANLNTISDLFISQLTLKTKTLTENQST